MSRKFIRLMTIVLVIATVFSLGTVSAFASEAGYINRDDVNMRSGAGTGYSVIATYNIGQVCYITAELSNGWCQVSVGTTTGYVYGKYVSKGTEANTTTGLNITSYVNSNNVAVRAGASYSARVLSTASSGTQVRIVTQEGDFCGVIINGTRGYIASAYLGSGSSSSSGSSVSVAGYINRDAVNMRSGAGTGYTVIANYDISTTCTILQELNNGWCKVLVGSTTGYIYGQYVTKGTPSTTTGVAGYINANYVNFRAGAGTTSTVLGCFNKNTVLTIVTEENSGWCGVIINGQRGYVWGAYVSKS